mgnify:CR=1 FL=1
MNRQKRRIDILCYIGLILGSLMVLIPIIYMISTSLKSINEIMSSRTVTLFPKKVSFEAYRNVVTEYPFFTYLKNSVVISVFSTIIAVLFSTLAGYGFSRFEFKTKGLIMMFILVTQMFPAVMLFVPYYKLLTLYGLANSRTGIVLVHIASVIPFCSWMMYGFFNSISRELDEAARIDGASKTQIAFKITILLLKPVLQVCATFSLIGALKIFDLIYVLTGGGPFFSTEVPTIYMYKTIFDSFKYGYGSAIAIFVIIECLILTGVLRLLFRDKEKA